MNFRIPGLVAAPHTPFRPNGEVALEIIAKQCRILVKNKVAGAFVCGTTGEGASLTGDERQRVVESWRAAAPSSLCLIVHVGHLSVEESRRLARHAQDVGADAVGAIAPSFFKPSGAAGLADWCSRVASAAPKLPFYYYHMPAMTGVAVSASQFLAAAGPKIPNLAGVKFTHEDLMDFTVCGAIQKGKYDMLFGRDEILLAGLAMGAKGAVGSTYNFAAPIYHRIIKSFEQGKIAAARKDQLKAMEFIQVLHRYGGLASGKAVMKMLGVDCGAVRTPLKALTSAEEKGLHSELEAIGFFEYACRA